LDANLIKQKLVIAKTQAKFCLEKHNVHQPIYYFRIITTIMFFKRKRRWSSIAFVLVASISIIYAISLIFSSIQSYASNYYRHTIYGNITVRRSVQQMRINIHILSIVNHRADLDEYQQAINSIRCYTSFHNYAFTLIILDEANETFAELCPQKDVSKIVFIYLIIFYF
jgi:hypothetical protein